MFMKNVLLIVCTIPTLALAQIPDAPGGPRPTFPRVPAPGGSEERGPGREKIRDRMMENLPPEIRARFEAAREKAMQDPKIQELKKKADGINEEFRKAMRDAMMKADPELAEILKERFKEKMKDGKPGHPPGFADLSDEDRQKLMAAREKAKSDPSVVAAEEKKKAAKTPEERAAANEAFHAAMRAALLKVDPSLGPVLDNLKPPVRPGPKGPPEGGPDEPMPPSMG